ncbi:hypothetical protein MCOR25_008232 [Pyricularia grisea]|uniref:Uncharacterized protein n=1 Tax=Pyricularia grisea TaxID=148305 RepID=A0A6P8B1A2_PYRGI|nr:uncharacterized protein PgNI_07964 [Pyricularia grisea]KAI6355346.1 hypothetical protein MCOR25_008232 [Pyricularia grisea]TLD08611.1 hypothetical protein PgNI_07964 [Pyricularia grisea]
MSKLDVFSNITSLVSQDLKDGGAFKYASYLVTTVLFFAVIYSQRDRYPDLPRLNPKGRWEFGWGKRVTHYMNHSVELLAEGTRRFGDKPYKLFTDLGDAVIIPPKYADELKGHRGLSFLEMAEDSFHGYVPGLDALVAQPATAKVVNSHLTKALMKLTAPLMEEASLSLEELFGESKEWHETTVDKIMALVSRISSRIFMGEELCRSKEWVEASGAWVQAAFKVVYALRLFPRSWRPYVHWFLPVARDARRKVKICREILQPHIDVRRVVKAEAIAKGEPNPFDDSIEWFEQECKTNYDPATCQLQLTLLAIHTTTDLLVTALVDIAKHPEIIGPLREEIINVLSTEGLKKSAFQKLRLMDAVLKESQRLRPLMILFFRRKALEDITLSDGFKIKKGTAIGLDGPSLLFNENDYPDALRWDPYRYIKMREAGQESKAHLVSVTPQHFGFGHGIHACPGRFFAANELKIALAQILLKYDIKVPKDVESLPKSFTGSSYVIPRGTRFLIRRRQEELDFNTLEM